MTFSDVH